MTSSPSSQSVLLVYSHARLLSSWRKRTRYRRRALTQAVEAAHGYTMESGLGVGAGVGVELGRGCSGTNSGSWADAAPAKIAKRPEQITTNVPRSSVNDEPSSRLDYEPQYPGSCSGRHRMIVQEGFIGKSSPGAFSTERESRCPRPRKGSSTDRDRQHGSAEICISNDVVV